MNGYFQHISFIGVDDTCLCRSNFRRDEVLLYGIHGTGNLYVTVEIDVPQKLSREQVKKLDEYEDGVPLKSCDKMQKFSNNVSAIYGKKVEKQ